MFHNTLSYLVADVKLNTKIYFHDDRYDRPIWSWEPRLSRGRAAFFVLDMTAKDVNKVRK